LTVFVLVLPLERNDVVDEKVLVVVVVGDQKKRGLVFCFNKTRAPKLLVQELLRLAKAADTGVVLATTAAAAAANQSILPLPDAADECRVDNVEKEAENKAIGVMMKKKMKSLLKVE
jgi:hypothetical protein